MPVGASETPLRSSSNRAMYDVRQYPPPEATAGEDPSMSNAHPTPYVPVELLGGRLVRVCPECKEQIGERTDDEGIVSNNFADTRYGVER